MEPNPVQHGMDRGVNGTQPAPPRRWRLNRRRFLAGAVLGAPLAAVAHAALAFTPAVTVSGEGVRLEVQSCLRCFGGLPALLQRLKAALAPLGHRLQIASAPTALGSFSAF